MQIWRFTAERIRATIASIDWRLGASISVIFALLTAASSGEAQQQRPVRSPVLSDGATLAVSCDTFLSSLGINTHVSQGYNPGSYVLPLRYIGVRNIRDSEHNVAGLILLYRHAGVRVDLLGADVEALTAAARTLAKEG